MLVASRSTIRVAIIPAVEAAVNTMRPKAMGQASQKAPLLQRSLCIVNPRVKSRGRRHKLRHPAVQVARAKTHLPGSLCIVNPRVKSKSRHRKFRQLAVKVPKRGNYTSGFLTLLWLACAIITQEELHEHGMVQHWLPNTSCRILFRSHKAPLLLTR